MGTEELDMILQSEINKQNNLKIQTNIDENINLVNQEMQNQIEDPIETNVNMVFDNSTPQ